jgi:hypothetical protein
VYDNPCEDIESLPLPKGWSKTARHAVMNVIGIVRIAMLVGRAALIKNGDVKEARIHQLESDLAMTREELRINGARMKRRSATTSTVSTRRTNGHPATAGHAWLEQGGNGAPFLRH